MTNVADRRRDEAEGPQDDPLAVEPDVDPFGGEGHTDDHNARRFSGLFGERFRYSLALGWRAWDGARWADDDRLETVAAARRIGHEILDEARELMLGAGPDGETKKVAEKHFRWAAQSLNVRAIDALLRLARAEPGLVVRAEEFDQDPWLFNCRNGTVDLRTGELIRPHRRTDLITKLAPVVYDPGAAAPTWTAFLERIQPDEEVRAFLRRLIGTSLVGTVREQLLPILHGSGANGKSTFVETLLGVVGDYGLMVNRDLLVAGGARGHPTELAQLRGARLVGSVEVDEGHRLSEALVKQLTGGETIRARFMREDFFDITPSWLVLYAVNHKPEVHGTDRAIWRRLLLVPFSVEIPEPEWDRDLKCKLLAEAPGILAWAVAGCLEYQEQGLRPPEEVLVATAAYRAEEDVLSQFLAECCDLGAGYSVAFGEIFGAFGRWCEEGRVEPASRTKLGRLLAEKGFGCERQWSGANRGAQVYRGLALRSRSSRP